MRVGVIGAGTMGNGIAQACATAGVDVVMVDVAQPALDRGVAAISASLERLQKKDKITADARDAALARVTASTDYATLSRANLVIEAATENLELKLMILKDVAARAMPVGREVVAADELDLAAGHPAMRVPLQDLEVVVHVEAMFRPRARLRDHVQQIEMGRGPVRERDLVHVAHEW